MGTYLLLIGYQAKARCRNQEWLGPWHGRAYIHEIFEGWYLNIISHICFADCRFEQGEWISASDCWMWRRTTQVPWPASCLGRLRCRYRESCGYLHEDAQPEILIKDCEADILEIVLHFSIVICLRWIWYLQMACGYDVVENGQYWAFG